MLKRCFSGLLGVVVGGLVLAAGCGEKDNKPPFLPPAEIQARAGAPGVGSGRRNSGTGGASAMPGVIDCTTNPCSGPSSCVEEMAKPDKCVCSEGYVLESSVVQGGSSTSCVVDKTCINIRSLGDNSCRQLIGGRSAVAAFFAVDYCAGTAVVESELAQLATIPGDATSVFTILQDGTPLDSEYFAKVIPRDVESYVTLAIDVSESISVGQPAFLAGLLAKLQGLVQALKPGVGEAPVGVSVLIFGKFVHELVPFTTNLESVSAKLGTLTDAALLQSLVGLDGTALVRAIATGISQTERIVALRHQVTQGGVLATGTLVVVADGIDNAGGTIAELPLATTAINLVSVGIGSATNPTELKQIGRDGAFSAPAPADLDIAFADITKRVDQYPDRAYLLGYCSPAVQGTPTVTISLKKFPAKKTAGCTFNAALFNPMVGDRCDATLFDGECAGRSCGGLTACGSCAGTQCCVGQTGQCAAPAPEPNCGGDSSLCTGISECTGTTCTARLDIGAPCGALPASCRTGTVCGVGGTCEATGLVGDPAIGVKPSTCVLAKDCESLRCERPIVTLVTSDPVCKRPAQIGDLCDDPAGLAACEKGSACVGGSCKARGLAQCSAHADCVSNQCIQGQQGVPGFCASTSACQFSWQDKMGM